MELSDQTNLASSATPAMEPLVLSFPLDDEASKKFSETSRYGQLRLRKRIDSGVWYAFYKHPRTGKIVERTLGTTLKKEALTQAIQWSAQLTNKRAGIADGTVPIKMLFAEYSKAIKGRKADETLKRLASSQHMLERWIEEHHPEIKLVKHFSPSIVRDFQNYRVNTHGVSKRTADNDVANLHTVFKWGEREGLVSKSPFDYSKHGTVQLYDEPQPDRDTYTELEYGRLVKAADLAGDFLIRDMIIVLADTGLRFGELQHLTPEALHWETSLPHIDIRARNGWKPKDPKEKKKIPMTPAVIEVLKRREAESDGGFLFHNREGNKVAENHSLERLKEYFPVAGIRPGRRLFWHSWRNHFVVRCLDANIPVHHIMRWTGHDSVAMVLHYAEARTSDQASFTEFGKLPTRGKNEEVVFSLS